MDQFSLHEELAYLREGSKHWKRLEETLRTQIAALEAELNASTNDNKAILSRLESSQQKHQLLIERQTETASSNARELANLQAECGRLKDALNSAKAQMLELEQANISHQQNERTALASLADIQARADAADARCHNLAFELEAGRRALEELRQLREENLDLKADLELYTSKLRRYEEEDSSTYEADSTDRWERDPLRKSPIRGTLNDWTGNKSIADHVSGFIKPRST